MPREEAGGSEAVPATLRESVRGTVLRGNRGLPFPKPPTWCNYKILLLFKAFYQCFILLKVQMHMVTVSQRMV